MYHHRVCPLTCGIIIGKQTEAGVQATWGTHRTRGRWGTVMNSLRSFPAAVRRGVPSGNRMVSACGNWPIGFAFFKVSFLPLRIQRAPWQATSQRNINFMALIAKAASNDSFSTKKKKLKGSRSRIAVKYLSPIKMCRGRVLVHPRTTVKYSEYLSPESRRLG